MILFLWHPLDFVVLLQDFFCLFLIALVLETPELTGKILRQQSGVIPYQLSVLKSDEFIIIFLQFNVPTISHTFHVRDSKHFPISPSLGI